MNGDLLKKLREAGEEDAAVAQQGQTIAVDFDGVIHSYTSGWVDADKIPDAPVEGAKEAIDELRKTYRVVIFSARARTPAGVKAMEEWLAANDIQVDGITAEKPPAKLYIDDRALTFRGDWDDTLAKVKTFKSYMGESILIEAEEIFKPMQPEEEAARTEAAKPKRTELDTDTFHVEVKESDDKLGIIIDVFDKQGELIDTYTYWNDDFEVTPGAENRTNQ